MLFGRWVMLSLYTLYKFTYLHNRLRRKALHLIHSYLCVELVSSRYSHIHMPIPSFKTVHNAQINITLGAKIQCATSFVLHCTHTATTLFTLCGPMLRMFHFQATYLRYRCTWSPSRYATCIHILLVGFRNQICVSFYHHMFYGAGRHCGWPYLSGGKSFLVHFNVLVIP
jgi:hypothetical protein